MSKWVSIQSLLAQEEDRQAEENSANKENTDDKNNLEQLTNQPNPNIPIPNTSNKTELNTRLVSNTSLMGNTSLVSEDKDAHFSTRLTDNTSLVSSTSQIINTDIQRDSNLWASIPSVKGHTKFYNQIIDYLYSFLDPYEQAVYTQLFRLSWGYGNDKCNIGLPRLAQRANISVTATQQALKRLASKGIVEKTGWTIGRGKDQGSEYRIPLPVNLVTDTSLTDNTRLTSTTRLVSNTTIKSDDHDDLKRQDHHQSEHEKAAMMIYQNITNNYWSKADIASYQKIKNIPLEVIETAIKLATQRAANRPNSLAYFVKEIINTANPPKQNRSLRKKIMEKIVDRVRNSFVGSSYSMSDFVYKVKDLCLKEDIAFENDLFDEIVAKKK